MRTTKTLHSFSRAALTLLMTLAMALTASATVTDFITDVMVIGNSNETEFYNLQDALEAQGWTPINKDLNAGCGSGSAYIHLLYKTLSSEESSGFPITDFYIRTGANPPDSLTHDERTYYLVPCAGSTSFVNGHGDLNAGCGSGSAYIFLYYTKDAFSNHESVTTITFNDIQEGGVGANGDDTGYDLNAGCGAGTPYIYMHVATQLPAGTAAPQRHLDACTGGGYSIHVGGWTFDPDAPWASLDVHVYVYTDASCSSQSQYGQIHILHANVPRPDVNSAYTIVGNHGFDETIPIADAGNYWVKVWAINYNGGSNPQIGTTTAVTVIHVVTLTPSTGEVLLHDGDTLTGTGGGNTHVSIADGATVTLSGATITSIPYDVNHQWSGLSCLGDAVIVLAEGTTNDIKGGYHRSGLYVPQGHTLTLQGSGTLNATGVGYAAGIGGNYQSSCGNITINGGNVTANGGGGGAAGIGGGSDNSGCGNITISGGTVNAIGGGNAAGIGSGYYNSSCGTVTISGGTVTANGNERAAGIGSGYYNSSCGTVTISGGTVTATGGKYAAGIGAGYNQSSCGNITITNGVTRVTAIKGTDCDNAIGESSAGYIGTITIGGVVTGNITQSPFVTFPYTVAFNANGGTGTMDDQILMYNIAKNLNANTFFNGGHPFFGWATTAEGPKVYNDGQSVSNLADTIATVNLYAKWRMHYVMLTSSTGEVLLQNGDTLSGTGGGNTHVSIADGATVTLSGANITNIAYNRFWPGLSCLGDAVIVLDEGTTNAIKGGAQRPGIHVPQGHTLTIQGSGTLNATGNTYAAGIGSGSGSSSVPSCGNITISGGIVNATGGDYAPGIGSGSSNSSCGNITISGGNVTANGGTGAAGIGSGFNSSSCGNITLSGGTITAHGGGVYSPGIGAGYNQSSCGDITITNGVTRVTAIKGTYSNNSIGANNSSTCGTVTIGGVVTGNISQSPFTTFPYTVAFNANGGTGTMADQEFMYNVAQNLHANSFTRTHYQFDGWATLANGPKVYDDGQSVSNLADTIATVTLYAKWGNPTFTLDIEGYGDVSNPGGWYLIASPVAQAIAPSADNGFITSEYDLYAFDHDYVGEQWRNYETDNFLLTNGMGYLYASELATTLTFTGTPYNGDGEIELGYNPNVSVFNGWNLVGNPYAQTAIVDRDFYVMNGDRSEVIAAEGSTVEPMEGLFVVADYDGETVTFAPNTRETRHEERIVINLSRPSTGSGTGVSTGSTSGVIDRAIVRFGAGKSLPKFMLDPSHTKLYIPQDGEDYAIVNATGTDEMPVHFKAESNGSYTITVKPENVELEYLHLIDNLTGADIDLLGSSLRAERSNPEQPASYSFEAKTTDYASRFKLVFATHAPEPVEGPDQPFAFCANGNLIVNGEGTVQVIDALGRILLTRELTTANCQLPTANLKSGVYVLRLVTGDSVRVQKIVIE